MTTSTYPSTRLMARAKRPERYFFAGMAIFAIALAAVGFVPEYIAHAAGRFPIAWVLHIHGAIMMAWIMSFLVQALLGATGRIALHRSLGNVGFAIGSFAWASMIFVEWRAILVNAPPDDLSAYDGLLPGVYVYLTFPVFLVWSYRRRDRPDWHKRLITFALFLSLQAAFQRYLWIPTRFGYWPFAAVLDVCVLAPLVAYDLRVLRRTLHAATVRGMLLLFTAQGALLTLWGTAWWREFAYTVVHKAYR
jgi:hypothetical protein